MKNLKHILLAVLQGLELEGCEQPAEGEQPAPSNIPWAHRARAGET